MKKKLIPSGHVKSSEHGTEHVLEHDLNKIKRITVHLTVKCVQS